MTTAAVTHALRGGSQLRAGRQLRALALLGLALLIWIAVRLPYMAADMVATLAALRPLAVPRGTLPPPMLALAATPPALSGDQTLFAPLSLPQTAPRHAGNPAEIAVAIPPAPETPAMTTETPLPIAADPPAIAGFALATQAYAQLAAGNRRAAAGLFDAALALNPDPQWRRDNGNLRRRWSADAYVLFRDAGTTSLSGPAATPILGGGQSGASLSYTIDPLARRRLAIVGRFNTANNDIGTAQAAVGLRWNIRNGIDISAERLIAAGDKARDDWTLRLAAGTRNRFGPATMTAYGEAGILGAGDLYAGAQARAALPIASIGAVAITAGPAAWASVQTGAPTTHRIDIGPSIAARIPAGRLNLDLSADWRVRIDGNAAPGSGPAVTLSTGF